MSVFRSRVVAGRQLTEGDLLAALNAAEAARAEVERAGVPREDFTMDELEPKYTVSAVGVRIMHDRAVPRDEIHHVTEEPCVEQPSIGATSCQHDHATEALKRKWEP